MSSKIATAILTGGLSLASPSYGKFATLGLLGDKSKKPAAAAGGASTASSVLSPKSDGNNQGVLPITTSPLGDVSNVSLSRGRLLGS